jgi:proteic killer suppression protein
MNGRAMMNSLPHLLVDRSNVAFSDTIRINDRWRICFVWRENNAHEVEIVDYH